MSKIKIKEPGKEFQAQSSEYIPRPKKRKRRVWRDDDDDLALSQQKPQPQVANAVIQSEPPAEAASLKIPEPIAIQEDPVINAVKTTPVESRSENPKAKPAKRKNAEKKKKEETKPMGTQFSSKIFLDSHLGNLSFGFTRVPNEVFMALLGNELSLREIRVLLAIVRLTMGFNRDQNDISHSMLGTLTGMQTTKIANALKTIEAKGFITRVSGGITATNKLTLNYSKENAKLDLKPSIQNRPDIQNVPHVQEVSNIQTKRDIRTTPDVSHPNQTLEVSSDSDVQYIYNTTETTLSQKMHPAHKGVLSYLKTLKPKRKQDSERAFYSEIKKDFSILEIELAFKYLVEKGLPGSGEPCHSPMAFLAQAGNSVIAEVRKEVQAKKLKQKLDEERKVTEFIEREKGRVEQEFAQKANEEFYKAFSNPQSREEYIRQRAAELSKGPFKIPESAIENAVMQAWYEENKG